MQTYGHDCNPGSLTYRNSWRFMQINVNKQALTLRKIAFHQFCAVRWKVLHNGAKLILCPSEFAGIMLIV